MTTRATPFQLVYGQEAILPIEVELKSLRVAAEMKMGEQASLQERLRELEKLDEARLHAFQAREVLQKQRKKWYDQQVREKQFQEGQLVLLYDSKHWKKPGKLKMRWTGPFIVKQVFANGSVQVADLSGVELPTQVNGARLKLYHKRANTPESS